MEKIVTEEEVFILTDPWNQKAQHVEQGHTEKHEGQLGGREHKRKSKQGRLMGCGLWIGQCAYERRAQSKSSTT